ncbi:hypothetical protein JOE38_002574 [Clavibacter michiganensis]|uniref:hypothetical protein n=1 Tax=Clavibacter michiganensis TaxID=28447 RepID=UPI001957207A|nr:hypothetical protein [Clavibacter michiganensis]MBM7412751.1 hypothetical protein [Clavibacter michiganensis]
MKAAAAAATLALGLALTATGPAQADTRHAPTGSPAHVTVERAAGDLTAQERRHARTTDPRSGGRNHQQRPPHQGTICAGCAG